MQLDRYGVAHAPFASARSQLMDAVVFADLDILVHTPLHTGDAQAHARLIKVSQLIPDRPDINSIF